VPERREIAGSDRIAFRILRQHANATDALALLRVYRESASRCAAEKRDELASPNVTCHLPLQLTMERGTTKLPRPPITGKAKGERPKIPHLA
jgi:hypothetical protein